MTKAQTEIFGLVIVVLLISIGLLFAVNFMLNKEKPDLKKEFTETEIGYNVLYTTLGTTTGCQDLTVAQLIQDCYENKDSSSTISCGSEGDSCSYFQTLINDTLFKKTLVKWGYKYNLIVPIYLDSSNPTIIIKNADYAGERKEFNYPLPTNRGELKVTLILFN